MAFTALWLGVGLLGQLIWLPWLLIPRGLLLWPLGTALLLPWFLATGETADETADETAQESGALGRLGWCLAHSSVLIGCLFLSMQLSPELGFIAIVLPLFPVILGLHALAVVGQRGSFPFGLSGAMFVSELLLAIFPLR
ncbi:MAG TPA: hypothetical protein ENN19_08640 [Chloroflexi bacterium]|nr:hypothetical protein [Chloroflexota bacterium]